MKGYLWVWISLWAAWRGHSLHNELHLSQGISQFLVSSEKGKGHQDFIRPHLLFWKSINVVTQISFAEQKNWLWIWLMSLIWLMLGSLQDNVYTNYNNFPNILHLLLTSFEDFLFPSVITVIGNKSAGRKYSPWFS